MRNLLRVATMYGWLLIVWQLVGLVSLAIFLWSLWRLFSEFQALARVMGL